MKSLSEIVVLIFVVLQVAQSQNLPSFEGRIGQIVINDITTKNVAIEPFCSSGREVECDGCYRRNYCFNQYGYGMSMCPRESPYCVNTLEGAECRPQPESEFCSHPNINDLQCISEGFFPNPYDCHSYFYCYNISGHFEKLQFECPDKSYVFDENIEDCRKISEDFVKCPNFECFPNKTTACENIVKISQKYYAYCYGNPYCWGFHMWGHYQPIKLHKCKNNTEFTGSGCKFMCPSEGKFKFGDNFPGKYYECYIDGKINTLTYRIGNCPATFTFNDISKRCVITTN